MIDRKTQGCDLTHTHSNSCSNILHISMHATSQANFKSEKKKPTVRCESSWRCTRERQILVLNYCLGALWEQWCGWKGGWGEVREEGRGDLHVLNYSAFKPQEDKNGVKWGDKLWTLKKKTVAFDTRQTRILNSMKYNFLMKYLCNTHLILHIFMHMVLFLWSEQEMFKTSLWRQTPLL